MNKDNAHLYLPLVQALADGKTIQCSQGDDKWIDMLTPAFLGFVEYRIKPEPRECWVAFGSQSKTPIGVCDEPRDGFVKVREVTE